MSLEQKKISKFVLNAIWKEIILRVYVDPKF